MRIEFPSNCKKNSLNMLDEPREQSIEFAEYSEQIQSVLAIYTRLLTNLQFLHAALMDKRTDQVDLIKKECIDLLLSLDASLQSKRELAEHLHTLYGHCLRKLVAPNEYSELEALERVQLVVERLRRIYLEVVHKEGLGETFHVLEDHNL
ncbi:MAG: flagellar protein FliS [Desulfovibrio sp.]|nr:flagellar protein FliS [Desulfovibrio sp.]